MAVVTTTIVMTTTYRPFERPPDQVSLWTSIPRGLRGFVVEAGVLDAKPINDDQQLILTGILPSNFAFIFAEIGLWILVDVAAAWDSEYTLILQDFYQGRADVIQQWNFDFASSNLQSTARGAGHTAIQQVPKQPMWNPRDTPGIDINISTFNGADPAGAAGTVWAYINFWEFDLEQAQKYAINAPSPVHMR